MTSESELSSDQGGHMTTATVPYCQPQHAPHPTLEQLRDKTYFARLQVKFTQPLTHFSQSLFPTKKMLNNNQGNF